MSRPRFSLERSGDGRISWRCGAGCGRQYSAPSEYAAIIAADAHLRAVHAAEGVTDGLFEPSPD